MEWKLATPCYVPPFTDFTSDAPRSQSGFNMQFPSHTPYYQSECMNWVYNERSEQRWSRTPNWLSYGNLPMATPSSCWQFV